MRVLATEVIDGVDREVRYVPENGSTVWLRVLDADGEVVSDVDTNDPAPPVEVFVDPDAVAQVLAVLAALTPEQLQRVVTLGVAVTEPAAVETLEQAVADGDAVTGVAVVADAAAAAQAAVEGE